MKIISGIILLTGIMLWSGSSMHRDEMRKHYNIHRMAQEAETCYELKRPVEVAGWYCLRKK